MGMEKARAEKQEVEERVEDGGVEDLKKEIHFQQNKHRHFGVGNTQEKCKEMILVPTYEMYKVLAK